MLRLDRKQQNSVKQLSFNKNRGTRNQIANICWLIEKAREFQKKKSTALSTMPKPLTVWITTNWKILKEMRITDHLTCLLRNLYAGQEATVRTRHGTMEWFQIGKGVRKVFYPAYLITCRVHQVKCHVGWSTSWIKIAMRNINNLRNADDATLVAESEEELKSLLMNVKEKSEKVGWNKDHGIRSHHFMGNRWRNSGNSGRLFWGAPKSLQMVTAAMKLKDAYS